MKSVKKEKEKTKTEEPKVEKIHQQRKKNKIEEISIDGKSIGTKV